jgi:uncharacterized membrane protein
MRAHGVAWVTTALVFLGWDAVWLSLSASLLYRPLLGGLLRDDFLLAPAALFYVIYTAGIVVFAISPSLGSGRWTAAGLRGLFLGLFGYAVYDLTNRATLRNWPVTVTVTDLIWGALLRAVAAIAGSSRRARSRRQDERAQSFTKPERMRPRSATSALALNAFSRAKAAYSVCE